MRAGLQLTPEVCLSEAIGQGGMGAIWRAIHRDKGDVVVKFLLADPATSTDTESSAETLRRFRREASLARNIRSPHAVKVLDFGVLDDSTPFIIMESLVGETLASRLGWRRRLPLDEVLAIVEQVCLVLGEAGALRIVHRDIKPANLFLLGGQRAPFVKVLDFGIAKSLIHDVGLTASGTLVGTPVYMSPEQLWGQRDLDERADLWSLAVVAYECITGKLPFPGASIADLVMAVHADNPAPPSAITSGLPAELDRFFHRAFQRERASRYGSAREMAETFRRAAVSR